MTTANRIFSTAQKVAAAIFLSISLISCGSSSPLGHDKNNPPDGAANLQVANVMFGTTEQDNAIDAIFATGTVTNVGDQPLKNPVTLTLTAHDKDGVSIESGSRLISNLNPGQTMRFTIIFKGATPVATAIGNPPPAVRPAVVEGSSENPNYARIALYSAVIE